MTSRLAGYGTAAAIFAADRATKWVIETRVSPWDTHAIIPGVFNIIHTQNKGAAFGLLADAETEWRTFILIGLSLLALILVAVLLWQPARPRGNSSKLLRTGLALILGGAMGNIYDRIVQGSVTDFLQVFLGSYEWPAFNVADMAISIGAALLLIDLWTTREKPAEAKCTQKS
jgi:signal peptidase II